MPPSRSRLASDGEEIHLGRGGLGGALAPACLGLLGERRHDALLDRLLPFAQLAERVEGGDDLGLAQPSSADIADADLAALKANSGACHSHLATRERIAAAGNSAAQHDQ